MLRWNENLYVHSDIKEEIEDIIKQIDNVKKYANIYLVIKSTMPNNLFEIVSVSEMFNGLYNDINMDVIGIARGKNAIKEILLEIVETIIDKDGNINKKQLFA